MRTYSHETMEEKRKRKKRGGLEKRLLLTVPRNHRDVFQSKMKQNDGAYCENLCYNNGQGLDDPGHCDKKKIQGNTVDASESRIRAPCEK